MIPTVKLPRGKTAADNHSACRIALEEFSRLEPTPSALNDWIWTSYRRAVVGGADDQPSAIHISSPCEITEAQARLARLRQEASLASGDFLAELPSRVNIARALDERGDTSFVPVDVAQASLGARVFALFLVDYLSRPEHYISR